MNEDIRSDQADFALSESAQKYLSKTLPDWTKHTLERGNVPMLSFAGAGHTQQDGKVTWEYRGALFLLASQKREMLRGGKYYDVMGFSLWMYEFDYLLLKGRVLTYTKVGAPHPEEHLVIENAPEDFFETVFKQGKSCASC